MDRENVNDNLDSQMYEIERKDVARAQKALGKLGKVFESHWVPIGKGLLAGRKFCMRITQAPMPAGKPYDDAFSGWLHRNGFMEDKDDPQKPFLKEKERTFLLRCMTHLDEITAWRAGLPEAKRMAWNHPRTVWEHFETAIQPAPDPNFDGLEEDPEDFENKGKGKPAHKAKARKTKEGKLSDAERAAELAEAHYREEINDLKSEINDLKSAVNDLKARNLELRAIVLEVGGKLPE